MHAKQYHAYLNHAYSGYTLLNTLQQTVSNEALVSKAINVYTGEAVSKEGWLDSIKGSIHSAYMKYRGAKYFDNIQEDIYYKYWKQGKPQEIARAVSTLKDEQSTAYENLLNDGRLVKKGNQYVFDAEGKLRDFKTLVENHTTLSESLFNSLDSIINYITLNRADDFDINTLLGESNIANLDNPTDVILIDVRNDRIAFDFTIHSKSSTVTTADVQKWFKDVKQYFPLLERNLIRLDKRLQDILRLMDKLDNEKKGLLAGYMNVVLGIIRTTIGFIFIHMQEFTVATAKSFLDYYRSSFSMEARRNDDDDTGDGYTPTMRMDKALIKLIKGIFYFLVRAFFTYLKYVVLLFILAVLTGGILAPIVNIGAFALTIADLYQHYVLDERNKDKDDDY